jgi:hypothetical protein
MNAAQVGRAVLCSPKRWRAQECRALPKTVEHLRSFGLRHLDFGFDCRGSGNFFQSFLDNDYDYEQEHQPSPRLRLGTQAGDVTHLRIMMRQFVP